MGVVCCPLTYVLWCVWHVHVVCIQRGGKKKKTKKLKVLVCGLRVCFKCMFEIMASGKKQTFDEVELSEMVVSPLAVVHGVFVGDAPSVKESRTKNGV